jgi:hypothetical protein
MNDATSEPQFQFEPRTVAEIVRGLDPIDWVQLGLLARLTPAQRVLTGMHVAEMAKSAWRGTLAKMYPEISRSELNMRVLAHFTTVRMESK